MATTTLTIGNDQLSTTMHILHNEWRDGQHKRVAFCDAQDAAHGKGSPSRTGGTRLLYSIGLNDHSSPTALDTGFEKIDLSVSDVSVPAVYSWAAVTYPVVISGEEERLNAGDAAVLDLAETRVKSVQNKSERDFNKQMLTGSVAKWTSWATLNGVDNTGGYLEENAVAAQTNSVGGISKTTYSDRVGWQNQIFDGQGSFNNNGLSGLYDIDVEVRALGGDPGKAAWIGSRSGEKNLKRSTQASERYADGPGDAGLPTFVWNGVKVYTERDMPNAGSQSATDPISFYRLEFDDIHVLWDDNGHFYMSDFETVSGEYDVRSCKILIRGQLIAKYLGRCGIAFDLEAF